MKKVEAVVRQERLPMVRQALEDIGVTHLTITQVLGQGAEKAATHQWKGHVYRVDLVPKAKVEMVIPDQVLEGVVRVIGNAAHTGQAGDGKIFVSTIDQVISVRTGERDAVFS